jgi:hypothetical protein
VVIFLRTSQYSTHAILATVVLTWFYWSHGRYSYFLTVSSSVHLVLDLQMGRRTFDNDFDIFLAQIYLQVFITSAYCMRLSIPLGLNMCPPFHSIAKTDRPLSIIAPARTVIEDEMRRNAFWLSYAIERQHGMGNGWALCLDDQDISQLLPVRGDQFEQGVEHSFPFGPSHHH